MTKQDTQNNPSVDLEGVPECFHEVVRTYGRAAFDIVMMTGLAQEALAVVAEQAYKHSSKRLQVAMATLGQAYNRISSLCIEKAGLSQETLSACEAAIKAAFVAEPPSEAPRIHLLH